MRYLLLGLFFVASACGHKGEQNFTVKGTLPDNRYDDAYVYLSGAELFSNGFDTRIDSALIRNGAFTLSGTAQSVPAVYTLSIPEAVGPHHTLAIVVDRKNMRIDYDDKAATLKGGRIAGRYNDLILGVRRDIEVKKDVIVSERSQQERNGSLSQATMTAYNERIREAYKTQIPNLTQFVRENIGNPVGQYFFFSISPDSYDQKDRAELYPLLPDTLRTKYEDMQKSRIDKQAYFQQSQALMREGQAAREISGLDIDGNRIALSDLRGKVVLIDIWASWCVPCLQEVPELKELYAKYKDRGFEIIGFSVDKDEQAWKDAIAKHELPWINITDMKAWDSQMVADFGIQAIPFTILIDRGGVIAARNIHAHNLRAALEKLFQ